MGTFRFLKGRFFARRTCGGSGRQVQGATTYRTYFHKWATAEVDQAHAATLTDLFRVDPLTPTW